MSKNWRISATSAKGLQVPACPPAGRHRDQAVDPGLGGLFGVAAGGDVVEHQAAVAMHSVYHFAHCAEAGDDDRYAVLDADPQVGLQPRIGVVDDQVHRIGRGIVQRLQAGPNLLQPTLETAALALVERREAADDAAAAAGQHQLRVGYQEHRRGHHRQSQALVEQGGQGHGQDSWVRKV